MAASQSFHADLDVLMLATNLIKKVRVFELLISWLKQTNEILGNLEAFFGNNFKWKSRLI